MHPLIKIDLENALKEKVILNLGCGPEKPVGHIGIDCLDLPNVDIVADLQEGFPFLPNSSVDEIISTSLFEHIDDLGKFMAEIVRVLKPTGKCHVYVPHFSNPFYYSDYTHKSFMGLYTFFYFVDEAFQPRRKVPVFYGKTRIRVSYIRLEFLSYFAWLRPLKKLFQRWVNWSFVTQEFYEENLCYLIPCYGMTVIFHPCKGSGSDDQHV